MAIVGIEREIQKLKTEVKPHWESQGRFPGGTDAQTESRWIGRISQIKQVRTGETAWCI